MNYAIDYMVKKMDIKYSDERSVQILLKVLKENNIRKVIVSPGTTNIAFVVSVKRDSFFEVFSCVDERAACYMAGGLAVESGEPVVITCTGATASRNYFPGLTEAFYRKIPILAITCAPHFGNIGRNVPQSLDRTVQPKDIVNLSVQIPKIYSADDEYGCNLLINKAVLELKRNGGGPVHINLVTDGESNSCFNTKTLPSTRIIKRIGYFDDMPTLDSKKVGIFVGSHKKMSDKLVEQIDLFCEKYDSVVLCDHTSNYNGKYRILPNIVVDQQYYNYDLNNFDVLIYIGEISGAYLNVISKETWRVNVDGELKDAFKNMSYIFEMEEEFFFEKYNQKISEINNTEQFNQWNRIAMSLEQEIDDNRLPLSNLFVAKKLINRIPSQSVVHLAILNSLRSWNYFNNLNALEFYSNTGGFGIDGFLSTLIGASMNDKNRTYYGIVGDLAFFYDLNSLGNNNVGNNLRIVLINNGCGTEFHNYSHPASRLEFEVSKYVAADGHFGCKSNNLIKNYSENLGFKYISAKNKKEFEKNIDMFVSDNNSKSIIFEIFTSSEDESEALKYVRSLKKDGKEVIKNKLKDSLSPNFKNKIKKVIKGE